jgi:hypothetical protein
MGDEALVGAIMAVRSQVDFVWQFFVTVHIAVFAMLFVYDHAVEAMNWVARLFALAGIAMFDWINGNALRINYQLLDALHEQFRFQFAKPETFAPLFYDRFVLSSFVERPRIVMITHTTAFVVVVLALFWRRFIQTGPQTRSDR